MKAPSSEPPVDHRCPDKMRGCPHWTGYGLGVTILGSRTELWLIEGAQSAGNHRAETDGQFRTLAPYRPEPAGAAPGSPEAEYVETKARFLAVTAGAGEWATIHRELGDLNGLSLDEIMRRGPAPIVCSQDSIKSKTRFLANPHGRSSRRPSRSASM